MQPQPDAPGQSGLVRARKAVVTLMGGLLWFPLGYLLGQGGPAAVALLALLTLGGCVYLWLTRLTAAGRQEFAVGLRSDWAGTVALLMALVAVCTAGFAVLSVVTYELGAGEIKGGPLGGGGLFRAAYSYYLWHFADLVPLINVPGTLNWKLEHPFTDTFQGCLALMYSILVVLPLVYAATLVVKRVAEDDEPSDRLALPGEKRTG